MWIYFRYSLFSFSESLYKLGYHFHAACGANWTLMKELLEASILLPFFSLILD